MAAVFAGCGGDEETAGVVTDSDVGGDVEISATDSFLPKACVGLKPDPAADVYNEQCKDITECTVMPKSPGSCWCATCGPKGFKIECLQVHCETPGQ